jgi:phage gp36-like protein
MAYIPYADVGYYAGEYEGTTIPSDELNKALKQASRHIDALTYNRIVGRGISSLTDFQQDIIREVCCELADFEYENSDYIESVLKQYGINGVSMSFEASWNLKIQSGVAMKGSTYQKLSQTGLCWTGIGRCR